MLRLQVHLGCCTGCVDTDGFFGCLGIFRVKNVGGKKKARSVLPKKFTLKKRNIWLGILIFFLVGAMIFFQFGSNISWEPSSLMAQLASRKWNLHRKKVMRKKKHGHEKRVEEADDIQRKGFLTMYVKIFQDVFCWTPTIDLCIRVFFCHRTWYGHT